MIFFQEHRFIRKISTSYLQSDLTYLFICTRYLFNLYVDYKPYRQIYLYMLFLHYPNISCDIVKYNLPWGGPFIFNAMSSLLVRCRLWNRADGERNWTISIWFYSPAAASVLNVNTARNIYIYTILSCLSKKHFI